MRSPRSTLTLAAGLALVVGGCVAPGHGAKRAPEGLLVVLNKHDDTVSLIESSSGKTLFVVPVGEGPHEAIVTPDGSLAVIANYGDQRPANTLTLVDLVEGNAVRTIELGSYSRPHGLAFHGPERVLVTAEAEEALLEVDLPGGEIVRAMDTSQASSHMVAVAPDGKRAYVANVAPGSVSVIDLESGELVAVVPTGAGCEGIDVSPDGRTVWTANRSADTLSVIDAASLEVLAQLPCPGYPLRVKLTPGGTRALVSCARAGELAIFDAEARELLARVSLRAPPEDAQTPEPTGESPVPIGLLVRTDGRVAFVTDTNTDLVLVVDLEELEVVETFSTGQEPDGLAWAAR